MAFLGGFEGSWLFLVVPMVVLWFFLVFGSLLFLVILWYSWWFFEVFGVSRYFLVVLVVLG